MPVSAATIAEPASVVPAAVPGSVGPMLNVEVLRGDLVESVHRIRACAVDRAGVVIGEAKPADADWPIFMRSAAKPFQAAPAAAAGFIE